MRPRLEYNEFDGDFRDSTRADHVLSGLCLVLGVGALLCEFLIPLVFETPGVEPRPMLPFYLRVIVAPLLGLGAIGIWLVARRYSRRLRPETVPRKMQSIGLAFGLVVMAVILGALFLWALNAW